MRSPELVAMNIRIKETKIVPVAHKVTTQATSPPLFVRRA